MIDFAHTHPSTTPDESYITGLSELVYLFQAIAAQSAPERSHLAAPALPVRPRSPSPSSEKVIHFFVKTTFRKPTWCSWCHSFLYGIYNQGYSCDCGYVAHSKCLRHIENTFAAYCAPTLDVLDNHFRKD